MTVSMLATSLERKRIVCMIGVGPRIVKTRRALVLGEVVGVL